MTNATKSLFGLGSDAVPDDVFQKLQGNYLKVGDTLTTTRTDLGDNWMLCNGEILNRDEYPLLSSEMPSSLLYRTTTKEVWNNTYLNAENQGSVQSIRYVNGYYVICGSDRYNSGNFRGRIAYTKNPSGSWTIIDMYNKNNLYFESIKDIVYANGYYVVVGMASNYIHIAYTTSLTSNWTMNSTSIGAYSSNTAYRLKYLNGYFIVCARLGSSRGIDDASIVYTNNPTLSWTVTSIKVDNTAELTDIIYEDGKYILALMSFTNESPTTVTRRLDLYSSEYLNGPWTRHSVMQYRGDANYKMLYNTRILFYNGYYILVGPLLTTVNDVGKNSISIIYSESLNGPWEYKDIVTFNSATSYALGDVTMDEDKIIITGAISPQDDEMFANLDYDGGTIGYVAFVNKNHFYDSDWVVRLIDYFYSGSYSQGNSTMFGFVENLDYIIYAGSIGGRGADIAYIDKSFIELPTISLSDLAYTYIKVKEG